MYVYIQRHLENRLTVTMTSKCLMINQVPRQPILLDLLVCICSGLCYIAEQGTPHVQPKGAQQILLLHALHTVTITWS